MLAARLFVGVARGISVALTDGQVLDTILYSLATPLAHLPGSSGAVLMVPMHALLHVPVPSVSGQAVLTMPIMAPLCDLLGLSRDAAVIAYQTGAGLMDMITPTNGALLAMLLGAKVTYGRWLSSRSPARCSWRSSAWWGLRWRAETTASANRYKRHFAMTKWTLVLAFVPRRSARPSGTRSHHSRRAPTGPRP